MFLYYLDQYLKEALSKNWSTIHNAEGKSPLNSMASFNPDISIFRFFKSELHSDSDFFLVVVHAGNSS